MSEERRIVAVTGASRGLGASLVEGFVEAGCRVVACARGADAMESAGRRHGDDHHFASVDVSDDAAVAAWAEEVDRRVGVPDLVVNNAAIINASQPLWTVPPRELQALVDINIVGVANVIRHFAPRMIASGRGVFANFSSGWGRSVAADVATYCASKWAVEGLSLALARDLPEGLASVPVNPGIIDTDMLRSCFGGEASAFPGPVEWSERAVPFLLSLNASHNGRQMSI